VVGCAETMEDLHPQHQLPMAVNPILLKDLSHTDLLKLPLRGGPEVNRRGLFLPNLILNVGPQVKFKPRRQRRRNQRDKTDSPD
jgi:hypothetical protein